MGLEIGTGITISTGITIAIEAGPLKSALSPAGQIAYDSATVDSWFEVSGTDYGNVKAALTTTLTQGYTDAYLVDATTSFPTAYGTTLNNSSIAVPQNYYVVGLVSRMNGTGILNFNPAISTTFRGTYSNLGTNVCTMTQSDQSTYWLRKNPPLPAAVESYVAISRGITGTTATWGAKSGTAWGSGDFGGAYSTTLTSGSWTNFNIGLPAQQWLLTGTRQW